MVRAVFEGVALNSAWLLGAVEKYCKRSFPSLAFVGGGANSDLWSQIHADATGRTIRQIEDPVLANVRGAGLLTLLALGHLTIDDIPGTVTVKATYEPDPAAGEIYAGAAQGVRQPLREDEGHPQATERPPPHRLILEPLTHKESVASAGSPDRSRSVAVLVWRVISHPVAEFQGGKKEEKDREETNPRCHDESVETLFTNVPTGQVIGHQPEKATQGVCDDVSDVRGPDGKDVLEYFGREAEDEDNEKLAPKVRVA